MTLSLGFAGDFCMGGSDSCHISVADICRDAAAFTQLADITFANFESCIVENGKTMGRFMAIHEPQCGAIADSGIDVFSLANNHIRDCGDESLLLTKKVLSERGIETVGAGKDIDEANAPLVLSGDGKLVAFIGATDATHYKARVHRPGIATLNARRLRTTVKRLRNEVDLIVVGVHSDLEFTNYPAPWKVRLSRQLAEVGADIVVHHHPHTLQGIEIYKDALIAYSLGNFIFPVHGKKYMENRDGNVDEAVFLKAVVDFEPDGRKSIAYELIPILIGKNNRTQIANGPRGEQIVERMATYSGYLKDWPKLRKQYFRSCIKLARSCLLGTYYSYRRGGVSSMFRYLKTHFSTQMHRRWMRGLMSFGWY